MNEIIKTPEDLYKVVQRVQKVVASCNKEESVYDCVKWIKHMFSSSKPAPLTLEKSQFKDFLLYLCVQKSKEIDNCEKERIVKYEQACAAKPQNHTALAGRVIEAVEY